MNIQGPVVLIHPMAGGGEQPWRGSPCHTSSVDDDDGGGDGGDDEGEGGNGKE